MVLYPLHMTVEIPEEQHGAALRALAEAVRRRDEAEAEVRARIIEAARVGANRTRIKTVAGISSSTLYALINEAGITVRPKRTSKGE
ncbi:hypothetical protein ACFYN0_34825 [Streptomyces sp. NPDC006704]|uniref:hypothetical protein n=1 Tax=Streptomyces sp. NPDC006704 TaxID=3364760 RepID=UPI00367FB704